MAKVGEEEENRQGRKVGRPKSRESRGRELCVVFLVVSTMIWPTDLPRVDAMREMELW